MAPIAPETARWVELVTGERLDHAEALIGGMSSAVHRCVFADGTALVVRHITDKAWLDREPGLIAQEARALELLAPSAVPAPRLVAADATSGRLLMTVVDGELQAGADDVRGGAAALAETAARIATVTLPADHGLTNWRSWAPADPEPPDWGDAPLWRDGIWTYQSQGPPSTATPQLLHRDVHPLNVLWDGTRVSGVVDWVNACVGHPHAELGHCRWNLATMADLETADAFLDHYRARVDGEHYDPWWDVAAVIGLLPGPIGTSGWRAVGRRDLTDRRGIESTEAFLRAALNRRC